MSLYTVPMILVSFSQKLKLYSEMFIDILQFSGKKIQNFTLYDFLAKIMQKQEILQFSGKK